MGVNNFNREQLQAIESEESKIFVTAPPGSGKSATLIEAAKRFYEINPDYKITIITFTRKATQEIKDRIGAVGNLEISTIHSWAWKRLCDIGNEYGFVPHLLEEETIKTILKRLCSLRKQYYINQFMLYNYVMGNYNIDVDDRTKRSFETIALDYVKFKRKNSLYDFTDLPLYLYDVMNEYEIDINDIDGLFVDEFQDVDEVQLAVFNKVNCKKKFYIGDPRQSIYQFRSAVDDVISRLTGFTFYNLTRNYRSYQEIIDYAETVRIQGKQLAEDGETLVASSIDYIDSSDIVCERGFGGKVIAVSTFGKATDCVNGNAVNDSLAVKEFLEDNKTQILCRSNKQVKKLQTLGFINVSTVHQAKGLEYDNVIVVDAPITGNEELNICYVAITRAKNKVMTIPFDVLLNIICKDQVEPMGNRLF